MVKWGCSYHSRTNGRNSPPKPWEIKNFLVLSLFFHLSFPKIWHTHPIEILFSKLTRVDLLPCKVYKLEVENCGLKLGDFLLYFTIIRKKHSVVEWLSWLPCKSSFINSNSLETLKDRPNIPTSLKLLEQKVYELVGGPLTPLR